MLLYADNLTTVIRITSPFQVRSDVQRYGVPAAHQVRTRPSLARAELYADNSATDPC